jgi:hypothetical protein
MGRPQCFPDGQEEVGNTMAYDRQRETVGSGGGQQGDSAMAASEQDRQQIAAVLE